VAGSHVHEDAIGFCSYCGHIDGNTQRVCTECGLGVRLETSGDALKSPDAAFLVVRRDGRVAAASAAAERMLANHGELIGKSLLGLVTSHEDDADLSRAVSLAAAGNGAVTRLPAMLTGTVRSRAAVELTVAACGLPPAALVVLERA
jgi:hypothetical protein